MIILFALALRSWSTFVGYGFKYNWNTILCLVYLVQLERLGLPTSSHEGRKISPRRSILMLQCGGRDSRVPRDDKAFWFEILAVNSCPSAVILSVLLGHLVALEKEGSLKWLRMKTFPDCYDRIPLVSTAERPVPPDCFLVGVGCRASGPQLRRMLLLPYCL